MSNCLAQTCPATHSPTVTQRPHSRGTAEPWEIERAPLTLSQQTSDVRIDPALNKKVWEQGVKGIPYRIRVRISRRRNDEEDAKEKLYSYVQAVNVKNPKGLVTVVVEE
jgi:hypothetical protein